MSFNELVEAERSRQDAKWGIQDHNPMVWLAILTEEVGELAKAILEYKAEPTAPQMAAEAKELVQVAAVSKAMWESCKRNGWL